MKTRSIKTFALLVAIALAPRPAAAADEQSVTLPPGIPLDLWELLLPENSAVTPERVALGRKLYFDTRLSGDGTVSCATCHDPAQGFADGKRVAEGIGGQTGARNSPTVLNAVFNEFQFWDGRAATLEEQAKGPFINPVEMGLKSHDEVERIVRGVPEYEKAFQAIYGREAVIDDIVAAIAAFERIVVSGNSAFDRYSAGDRSALSESAKRGLTLWSGKGRCNTCHPVDENAPFFTDNKFHNIGVAAKQRDFAALARKAGALGADADKLSRDKGFSELGRFLVSKQPKDIGAFKTPGLRDVALTAPYMHDGSEESLASVVEFYDRGGEPNPYLDGGIVPLKLTAEEKADVVAFMNALTSEGEGAPDRPALLGPNTKTAEEKR